MIHANETPFNVIRDGRDLGTNSYMWVYRSGARDKAHPIVICDYQESRQMDHPEEFLRVFLNNGDVPMDNKLAEQAIRPFTVGRKNWVTTNSKEGAESNAILYSLVETAKTNDIHVYNYINYVLEERLKHADDTDRSFIKDLLPWSDKVREKCPVLKKTD